MLSLLLMSFMLFVLRNINLRVFQELVLIIKMHMLHMLFRQLCTWQESSCYKFHLIGLNMVLMIWHCDHLLSSMQPGCTIEYLVKQWDSLQYHCSPRLVLIIKFFLEDVLLLFWTPSFKTVRKLLSRIIMFEWVSSLVSQLITHLWF